MCKQFTILVEQSEWHDIARCEHGAPHLRWGHRTLARMALPEYATHQPATDRMRLQVERVTVEFPVADLHFLLTLMQQALTHVDGEGNALRRPLAGLSPLQLTTYLN